MLQAGFSESFVILAVAASMLTAAYHMLRDGTGASISELASRCNVLAYEVCECVKVSGEEMVCTGKHDDWEVLRLGPKHHVGKGNNLVISAMYD
ncbi:hypothetical protein [Paraburkholderia sp.]|uniref:hypothetical protein n=1 Tax=Paraburkholderia sp. TaxID=1926495 RepID=UPI003428D1E4